MSNILEFIEYFRSVGVFCPSYLGKFEPIFLQYLFFSLSLYFVGHDLHTSIHSATWIHHTAHNSERYMRVLPFILVEQKKKHRTLWFWSWRKFEWWPKIHRSGYLNHYRWGTACVLQKILREKGCWKGGWEPQL